MTHELHTRLQDALNAVVLKVSPDVFLWYRSTLQPTQQLSLYRHTTPNLAFKNTFIFEDGNLEPGTIEVCRRADIA